jgi:NAD(P)H-flavin reductase/hemoglobin-like flavoprotein
MDPAALKTSWAQIARHGDAVPGFFYAWLFTAHPHLRELFPMSMASQRDRLVAALGRVVSRVDELPTVVPFVESLGRNHRRFDIKPDSYPQVGEALLATLAHFLGPMWTPQLAADWTAAYQTVASVMIGAAEAAAEPPWWSATVLSHEKRGFDVAVLRLQPDQPYPYRAGQALTLELPSRPKVWRYYSPANAPRRDGTLDLHIKAVPGGQLSTAVVTGLTAGDTVKIGPPGSDALVLDPASTRPLLLVAGGTGLSPLKALVEQAAVDGGRRQAVLFVGARTEADLYDLPVLQDMARMWPWLTVVPAASDDSWYSGERGVIGDVAARLGRWHEHDVYICGSSAMVAATRQRLLATGVRAERIRSEDDTCDPYRPPTADEVTSDREAPNP